MKKKLFLPIALLLTITFSLCGCDGLIETILSNVNFITDVTFSESSVEIQKGATYTVTADFDGLGEWDLSGVTVKSKNVTIATVTTRTIDEDSIAIDISGIEIGSTTVSLYIDDEDAGESISVVVVAAAISYDLSNIPEFDDVTAYVILNDNVPFFTEDDYMTEAYEFYSPLDDLGRCGMTIACVCIETMPTEERGAIGSVKPTGWHTVKYDIISGKYLYNRCHLIGYQLTAENANERNLITGTRFLNIEGNLVFENMVADYVKETHNHVMYRVTPVFVGDELVARGVIMEGYSVEDNGEGICYNVYCYNAQPGIVIDYATGDSHLKDAA